MWPFKSKQYPTVAKAVHNGDLRAVRRMLERGDDPDSLDGEYGVHAIHFAVGRLSWETADYQETVEIVKLLVQHGANVNLPAKGRMPLWVAEAGDHREVAEILRRAGAHLRAESDSITMRPAAEKEIRKAARDLAFQIRQMCPGYSRDQMADAIESKINVGPAVVSAKNYEKFKQEVRSIVLEVLGET